MSVSVYIARNHLGEFSVGHGWTDAFERARFKTQRGPISAAVTRWVQAHPDQPVPEILKWDISPETAQISGSADEAKKRVSKIAKRKVRRQIEYNAQLLEHRRQEAQRLQAEIARLEGRA